MLSKAVDFAVGVAWISTEEPVEEDENEYDEGD